MNSYAAHRLEVLEKFAQAVQLEDAAEVFVSPSGLYQLEVTKFSTGADTWNYSRGVVSRVEDGVLIADIKRNYGAFWHSWVVQPNGLEFLLCGEDYQGYNVIALNTAENHGFFSAEGLEGRGFCWAAVHPSPDGLTLAVEGCYWACPYELVFYDFAYPTVLPLPELARPELSEDDFFVVTGWQDNQTFEFTVGQSQAEQKPQIWQRD